jgi:hypothetical protein
LISREELLNMKDTEKMLIPICRDHFKRLVKNDVCSSCPSRIENEQIVEKLSELYRDDEQGTLKAIFIEIQSLRRLTSTQQEKIEQIEKLANEINIVLFGINRTNGINGEVKSVKQEIRYLQKYVWIIVGAATILQIILIPLIKILTK